MQHRPPRRPARPAHLARGPLLLLLLLGGFQALLILPLAAERLRSAGAEPRVFAWQPRADALRDRVEGVGALVQGRVYLFGGFVDSDLSVTGAVDRYDPVSDSWEQVGAMPTPASHIVPAVDGDTVWLAGGFVGDHPGPATDEVWAYHAPTNSWSPGPALPEPRAGGALVRFRRSLHYFGGFAADRNTTVADHWVLNLDGPGGWQPASPMPEPRGHLSVLALGDAIYALGGQVNHDQDPVDKANVYRYTPLTDSWAEVASLPTPRSHFEPSTFELHGRIVVVGGRNNTVWGEGQLATALLYAPEADQWIRLPSLPFTRLAPVALPLGDEILVTVGGLQWDNPQRATLRGLLDQSWELEHPPLPEAVAAAGGAMLGGRFYVVGAETTALQAYGLAEGAWAAPEGLAPRPHAGAGGAVLADGERLLLFGGEGASAGRVQRYDPATNGWTEGAAMPAAATDVAAARAVDGSVYVAWSAPQPGLARYDAAADSWEPLASPPLARLEAAAATDGKQLYLFGGSDASGPTDSVQIYDIAAGSWATSEPAGSGVAPLPMAQRGARAVALGGSIYLLGGRGADGAPVADLLVYEWGAGSWRSEGARPGAIAEAAVAAIAGRIYVAGGGGPAGEPGAALAVYNATPLPAEPLPLRYYLPGLAR